ncbi:elongation factor G [Candidatus Aerophobetes bacterium]|uniref:Elongation factor G n=2 Tax=Aerophobetes bacterium TaxID=2030807 RepID=A0A662DB17_UNCAE|nr:MAG: elongation factor G [Candidatus Aerophobetes bacterium]
MPILTKNIRNVAIVGQQGSGKTTLTEAILYRTGAISKMGSTKDGSTVTDYDRLEKERGFTINPSLVYTTWKDKKINLIDTPGFPDLIEKVRSILKVVEISLMLLSPDTISGSEIRRVYSYSEKEKLSYLIFLNKIEGGEMNFSAVLEQIKKQLNLNPLPLTYPFVKDKKVVGIIDLIRMKGIVYTQGEGREEDIPEELISTVTDFREKLMESVAETDDQLIEKYLENGDLTEEEIKQGLKEGILSGKLIPLLTGSALSGMGVDVLLDILVDFFPSPDWRGSVKGMLPGKEDEQVERKVDSSQPLCAQVFFTLSEMHLGEVSFIKVFSGNLSSGSSVYNAGKNEDEKIGQIYLMRGNKREETPQLVAGDMGALTKLKSAETGDTFSTRDNPVVLPRVEFPETNTFIALKPKNEKDEQRLSTVLARLAKVDPLLKVEVDKESGQTILSGMGEVHLELVIDRIKKDFNIDVETEEPEIPYRETITASSEAQGKYKRQSGGRGQYGDVWLRIKPLPRGEGFKFVDEIKGGVVPARFIPSVEKGVREAMKKGNLAGYPMVDMEVTLFDGSYHSVDSSDIAFQIAASMGLRKAVDMANPILLEPIMELEVEVPSDCLGDVNGDLSSRRGKILEVQPLGGRERIKANVPLSELRNYSTTLRSITQGRGSFTQRFSHYERVPDEIAQKIISQRKSKKES